MAKDYVIEFPSIYSKSKDKFLTPYDHKGYPAITFVTEDKRRLKVLIHRIVAYQKFGEKMFEPEIIVRHKNHDKEDFSPDNLLLGTNIDNWNDNTPEHIEKCTKRAYDNSMKLRSFTEDEVRDIRARKAAGETLKMLVERYKCAQSTLSYIINRITYPNVV